MSVAMVLSPVDSRQQGEILSGSAPLRIFPKRLRII
jgi:hypothetical protein